MMSLDAHTRFFNAALQGGLIVLLSLPLPSDGLAQTGPEDDFFLRGLARQQQQAMGQPGGLPEWLKTKPMAVDQGLADVLAAKPWDGAPKNGGPEGAVRPGCWLFVSFGMPDEELKACAKEAAETGAVLVFRGIREGENTGTLALRLAALAQAIKPTPGAVIDPLLFRRHNVLSVPALVSADRQGRTRKVAGLAGFSWLERQDVGDLGQKGPVYGITEPDMVTEIQRRIALTDWASQKQHALDHFWKGLAAGTDLPEATTSGVRYLDPSITVTQDIYHPNGKLIARKGDRLNPQALMPMQHDYIIFDATQKKQVELVKRLQSHHAAGKRPLVFLFSRIGTDKGWDAYNTLSAELSGPVYQLNKALKERFQIRALPTVVEGHGDRLAIREVAAGEGGQ